MLTTLPPSMYCRSCSICFVNKRALGDTREPYVFLTYRQRQVLHYPYHEHLINYRQQSLEKTLLEMYHLHCRLSQIQTYRLQGLRYPNYDH